MSDKLIVQKRFPQAEAIWGFREWVVSYESAVTHQVVILGRSPFKCQAWADARHTIEAGEAECE